MKFINILKHLSKENLMKHKLKDLLKFCLNKDH